MFYVLQRRIVIDRNEIFTFIRILWVECHILLYLGLCGEKEHFILYI